MSGLAFRPCLWTLPSSQKTLYMEDLNHDDESQRQAAFQLITDAAQRADNIGVDEFPQKHFDLMLYYTDVAVQLFETHHKQADRRLLGLIIITDSRFIRIAHPTACQLFLVTATDLSGRQVWRDLAGLGVALAAESKHRYIDCFVEVYVPCLEHVLAMRDVGFIVTACIPTAGILAGHSGHVDSYVMYKQLHVFDTHSQLPTMLSMKNDVDDVDDEEKLENLSFTLRPLPDYLPCRCDIDGGRTQIIIRPLRRDEVGDFYAAMKEAAASGNGYGFDELPGLAYFVRWYVDDKYNLVYELAAPRSGNGESFKLEGKLEKQVVVGYVNFGPSVYARSHENPALFDGNIVLHPEFRGRRWIGDLTEIRIGIGVDCGVRCFFEESFITNVPATRSLRRTGANVCGTIPRNTYVRDLGFVDGVLFYKSLDEGHSFRLADRIVHSKI